MQQRRRCILALVIAFLTVIAGCSTTTPKPRQDSAVIRVHVRLTYSHPAGPTTTTFNGPMRSETVLLRRNDGGASRSAVTDADGIATARVRPGSYTVDLSDGCAKPSTVALVAGSDVVVELNCVAP